MSRKTAVQIARVAFLLLMMLHFDFWRPKGPEIVAGGIPVEVLYRLAWMAGAFFFLVFLCDRIWEADGR